ncbi:LOW QUALITY PROTEIN: hypothetical protein MXB_4265, partial [Myxobolus squamalis]
EDDLLLSPNNCGPTVHINIVSFRPYGYDCPKKIFWALFAEIMEKYKGRPHWGKLHKCSTKHLKELYGENINKFIELKKSVDPENLFYNKYYKRHFEGIISKENDNLLQEITNSP